jgi:hypothetical protein
VTGNKTAGFEGYDTYDGGDGNDKDAVVAYGGQVDIGLAAFGAANGIEIIDASGASGPVRLLGDWQRQHAGLQRCNLARRHCHRRRWWQRHHRGQRRRGRSFAEANMATMC